MTRPTHKHSVMSLVLLLAIQNHLATELRDVSPYSFCHGTLVGFHTIAAGDKSFAPVSVSFTSVLTYDKWSDTAPCTLQAVPLSASKQYNSNPQILSITTIAWFSQTGKAVPKENVVR